MKRAIVGQVALAAWLVGSPAPAQRQPEYWRYFEESVPAREGVFEASVATGYTQGLGMLQRGVGMPSVATVGFAVDVAAGYRFSPRWALLTTVQMHELESREPAAARGMTGGLAVVHHPAPGSRVDPWIELGSGYRLLWQVGASSAPTTLTHGFEVARARIGVDVRVDPRVAFAPFVGADVNVFAWQDGRGVTTVEGPRASTFLAAGLQARFDIGVRATDTPSGE